MTIAKTVAIDPLLDRQAPESPFTLARAQRDGLLRHFGFRESPFGVTPDPEFLFWTEMHRAAFQAIVSSIESNLGFSVLIGKPGTGKTSLLFHLLAQYREFARTAFIFQTQCKADDLVRHIASELDLAVIRPDDVSLHQQLNTMLLEEARVGRKVLIVIDEAQNLQLDSFESVRLLSDFETGHCKLLNIVFSGSPQLAEKLMTAELSQLAQRISTVARLEPFSEDEVANYVKFRLAVAASRPIESPFLPEALAEIAARSQGIPRIINAICYRALMLAYSLGHVSVDRELVKKAAEELDLSESVSAGPITTPGLRNLDTASENSAPRSIYSTSEQSLKPPVQTFVERLPVRAFDATRIPGPSASASLPRNEDNALRGPSAAAKVDPRGLTGLPKINRAQAASHRYRSIELIAVVVLLVCASWVGWNQLRARPGATVAESVQSQPKEPVAPHEQSDTSEANRIETSSAVPPISVPQPNPARTVLPPTNSNSHQPAGEQAQPFTEIGNVTIPSRIPPPPAPSVELSPPDNAVPASGSPDSLAGLAAARPGPSLRLETEEPVVTSRSRASFSLHPIKVVQPEYPTRARLSHIEGEVQVEISIDRDGSVRSARALSGNAILAHAAEDAVRQWKYTPFADDDPIAFPTVTRVQFNFRFNSITQTRK